MSAVSVPPSLLTQSGGQPALQNLLSLCYCPGLLWQLSGYQVTSTPGRKALSTPAAFRSTTATPATPPRWAGQNLGAQWSPLVCSLSGELKPGKLRWRPEGWKLGQGIRAAPDPRGEMLALGSGGRARIFSDGHSSTLKKKIVTVLTSVVTAFLL